MPCANIVFGYYFRRCSMFICRKLLKGAAIVSRPWRADKDYKKSYYSFTLISLVIFGLFPLFEESHARPFSGYFLHLFVRGVKRLDVYAAKVRKTF